MNGLIHGLRDWRTVSMTELSAEEVYLESLYAIEEKEEIRPVLFDSQVIKGSLGRSTYSEAANDHRLITTHKARGKGLHGGSGTLSPIRSAAPDLQKRLDSVIRNIESSRSVYERCVIEASKAGELAKTLAEELRSLKEEDESLQNRKPPAPERHRKVKRWIEERAVALRVQQELAEAKQIQLISVEAGLRMDEAELDYLADEKQDLDRTLTMELADRSMNATALRSWEKQTGNFHANRIRREADRVAEIGDRHEEFKDKVISAAEVAQADARERLRKGLESIKRNKDRGTAVIEAQNEARQQAVLGLKSSMAAVREEVARKATRYRQLQKQKKEVMEKEFQDLLEKGLNPYEVHRKKDVEKQATRQRKAIRDNIANRQVAIAEQLALEEELYNKELEVRDRDRLVMEAFQREMGVSAAEQRTEKYMLKNTLERVNMLDPTGHLHPDPSAVTNFKTRDFGTGHAESRVLGLISSRHPDVEPKDLLMPNKYRPAHKMTSRSNSRKSFDDDGDDHVMAAGGGDSPPKTPLLDGSGSNWKGLETRPLTKFEQKAMESAKERHKASIGRPKVMMGRLFAGDAFLTAPSIALFKDFEVSQTYTLRLAVINRSYDRNTFRVVQVPPEHGNVLQVSYKLPGYLATGVSADIDVTFTPKTNEDIDTAIEMLSDTGPFFIPIRCLTKKATMSVSLAELDFGPGVILAETASRTFTISNSGALDVEYSISVDNEPSHSGPGADGKLKYGPFTVHQAMGVVSGYGSTTLSCVFAPSETGAARLPTLISFKSPDQRKLVVPPIEFVLSAIGRDVPIFLDNSVLDFKCSMVDHTYRNYLQVHNGGRVAMKINVVNKPDICDYFEFSPNFGFAQAGEAFPVTVIFKPKLKMMEQCAKYLVDVDKGIFEIPMKLNVPDQRLPVTFTLRAQVTTTDLVFDPPMLDFGSCVINEDTALTLRVTNPSALPQTFGFNLAQYGIGMKPNDGFGYILPGETLERIVSFQPPIPGPQTMTLTARTLAGRSFTLPCSAVGVRPGISLSHNRLAFPATPVNYMSMISVMLTNTTETSQAFEFETPFGCYLTFIPHVGEVPALSNLRVQVEFAPKPDPPRSDEASTSQQSELNSVSSDLSKTPSSVAPADPQQSGLDKGGEGDSDSQVVREGDKLGAKAEQAPWYRWQQWSVSCYLKSQAKGRSVSSGGAAAPDAPYNTRGGVGVREVQQLHLNIETCAVLPDIVLKTELPMIPDKLLYELDFGPVPVGQRVTRVIEICNQGTEVAAIRMDPLDTAEVFSVVNSMRPLPPAGHSSSSTFRVLLSFLPQQRLQYLETLTLYGTRTRIRVALKGLGIAPELRIDPPEALSSGLDMGDVFRGEAAERKFTVTNVCPFPLTFSMLFRAVPDPNLQMKPPFYTRPSEGTLAQGESAEIVVVFQPSNQRPYFEDVMHIFVPNQQEELLVSVKGRCWEEGIFLAGPSYPPPPEDPFMEKQLAAAAAAAGLRVAIGTTAAAATVSPRELVLNFPHPLCLGESATTSFEAGSLKSSAVGGAAGELVIDDLPDVAKESGWNIDPSKLPLAAGDKKAIQVRYTSPSKAHAGMAAYLGHEEWIELRLGATLKGGLPAPPTPEGRRVVLVFRVMMLPQLRDPSEALPPSISKAGEGVTSAAAGAKGKKK